MAVIGNPDRAVSFGKPKYLSDFAGIILDLIEPADVNHHASIPSKSNACCESRLAMTSQ